MTEPKATVEEPTERRLRRTVARLTAELADERAKVQTVRDELRKACDETAPPDAYIEVDSFQAGAWRMLRDRIDELLAAIGDGDKT